MEKRTSLITWLLLLGTLLFVAYLVWRANQRDDAPIEGKPTVGGTPASLGPLSRLTVSPFLGNAGNQSVLITKKNDTNTQRIVVTPNTGGPSILEVKRCLGIKAAGWNENGSNVDESTRSYCTNLLTTFQSQRNA